MNGRKRTIQVKFYVTEEERKLIEEKMRSVCPLHFVSVPAAQPLPAP